MDDLTGNLDALQRSCARVKTQQIRDGLGRYGKNIRRSGFHHIERLLIDKYIAHLHVRRLPAKIGDQTTSELDDRVLIGLGQLRSHRMELDVDAAIARQQCYRIADVHGDNTLQFHILAVHASVQKLVPRRPRRFRHAARAERFHPGCHDVRGERGGGDSLDLAIVSRRGWGKLARPHKNGPCGVL